MNFLSYKKTMETIFIIFTTKEFTAYSIIIT